MEYSLSDKVVGRCLGVKVVRVTEGLLCVGRGDRAGSGIGFRFTEFTCWLRI